MSQFKVKIHDMDPQIIFEDKSLMVINKPSRWITNSADTTTDQPVVQSWLDENFNYPIAHTTLLRSGVVHRLDKETSGILLIAKTKEVFEALQAQFKNRQVQKKYIALVHGEVEPHEGKIDITVGRLPWKRDRFGVLPGGRESVTEYKCISYYVSGILNNGQDEKGNTKNEYTLLELSPKTGRTHQIRIHMKFLGHPIVSDEFYAGRKTARRERKWCPRLFLHAASIKFTHPINKKDLEIKAELPEDLKKVLDQLKPAK